MTLNRPTKWKDGHDYHRYENLHGKLNYFFSLNKSLKWFFMKGFFHSIETSLIY